MTEFPAYFYRTGAFGRPESRIFHSAADVPEGWVDSPAKLEKKSKKPAAKAKKKAKADAE